jgi:hypothetical protein
MEALADRRGGGGCAACRRERDEERGQAGKDEAGTEHGPAGKPDRSRGAIEYSNFAGRS